MSATTGANLDVLVARLGAFAGKLAQSGSGLLARERHRQAFQLALAALDEIAADATKPVEIVAEQLRQALHALRRLIGAVDADDILSSVFTRFCIGK